MDDADARRHDAERVERLHAPFHELVAFVVALELELHVEVERVLRAVVVDHHRVVDDQVHGDQRFDDLGVAAHVAGHVAHRRQVREQRHAGEILQHDAGDDERDFVRALALGRPVGELPHVLFGDLLAVAVAQHRLEHDADGDGQPRDAADAGGLQRGQRVVLARACGKLEFLERLVEVVAHCVTFGMSYHLALAGGGAGGRFGTSSCVSDGPRRRCRRLRSSGTAWFCLLIVVLVVFFHPYGTRLRSPSTTVRQAALLWIVITEPDVIVASPNLADRLG